MTNQTCLYEQHLSGGAKLIDFAGWQLPIFYESQLSEHHAVRQAAGVFDVSHMNVMDIRGEESISYLRYILANDVAKLKQPGTALYSCMLNEAGGVIDDLIVYFIEPHYYRLVSNASTREKVWAWLEQQAVGLNLCLQPRTDFAILAVQGPQARALVDPLLPKALAKDLKGLKRFQFVYQADWLVARTGYTGEDGYEIIFTATQAGALWQAILAAGVTPCGLGARDTLRLEAGLNLYGAEMDETTSPLEANLAWTIAWRPEDRDFIGRAALVSQQKQGLSQQLVGLVLAERGVLRAGQRVILPEGGEGRTTSGTFSPSLKKGIALARVPANIGSVCQIEMRGKLLTATVVRPPFVKNGK